MYLQQISLYVSSRKVASRVKALKVGSRKHTKLSSSDKHIVGKTEYDSKADAKEEKGAETKECVGPVNELACYVCNPKDGKVLELGEEAKKNGHEKMWQRLVKRGKSCDDLSRRKIKKSLTRGTYLEIEKFLNDLDKYYTKEYRGQTN